MNSHSDQALTRIIQDHYARNKPPLVLSEDEVMRHALRNFALCLAERDTRVAEQLDGLQRSPTPKAALKGDARKQSYQRFFNTLVTKLRARGLKPRRKALARHYYNMSVGHGLYAQIVYSCSFNHGQKARVELYMNADKPYNTKLFNYLHRDFVDIDAEFGEDLEWLPLEDNRASRIATQQCDGSIEDDDQSLEALQDWMVDRVEKLDRVLGPRMERFVI